MNATPSGRSTFIIDLPSFVLNSEVVTNSGPRNRRPCL